VSPKSTKSSKSNFTAPIENKPESDIEFFREIPVNFSFFDVVDFGDVAFLTEIVI